MLKLFQRYLCLEGKSTPVIINLNVSDEGLKENRLDRKKSYKRDPDQKPQKMSGHKHRTLMNTMYYIYFYTVKAKDKCGAGQEKYKAYIYNKGGVLGGWGKN